VLELELELEGRGEARLRAGGRPLLLPPPLPPAPLLLRWVGAMLSRRLSISRVSVAVREEEKKRERER
jgi:hypothetical protein